MRRIFRQEPGNLDLWCKFLQYLLCNIISYYITNSWKSLVFFILLLQKLFRVSLLLPVCKSHPTSQVILLCIRVLRNIFRGKNEFEINDDTKSIIFDTKKGCLSHNANGFCLELKFLFFSYQKPDLYSVLTIIQFDKKSIYFISPKVKWIRN
jgi:hypothetical protein